MAFWGTVIKPNGSYKLEEEAGKLLHLSTISLGTFKDGRSLLKVEHEDSKQKVLVASLTPGQTESVSVDLFLNVLQNVTFHNEGSNELHLAGFFEVDMDEEDMDHDHPHPHDEMDEVDTEDSEEGDDDDDEDDEQDDDDEEDDEEEDDDEEDKEEDEEDEEATGEVLAKAGEKRKAEVAAKQPEPKKAAVAPAKKEEQKKPQAEQPKKPEEQKKPEQQKKADQAKPEQKKAEQAKPEQKKAAQGTEEPKKKEAFDQSGDFSEYIKKVTEFLKKNGPTPVPKIGSSLPKPAGVNKLGQFLKSRKEFSVADDQTVKLA